MAREIHPPNGGGEWLKPCRPPLCGGLGIARTLENRAIAEWPIGHSRERTANVDLVDKFFGQDFRIDRMGFETIARPCSILIILASCLPFPRLAQVRCPDGGNHNAGRIQWRAGRRAMVPKLSAFVRVAAFGLDHLSRFCAFEPEARTRLGTAHKSAWRPCRQFVITQGACE